MFADDEGASKLARKETMKKIELTKGYQAIIDDEDYDIVSNFKWRATIKGRNIKRIIPVRTEMVNGISKTIYLSRFLLGVTDKNIYVDHINRNTLDNRRSNLRECTPKQNSMNIGLRLKSSSGYKGVALDKKDGKWQVTISGKYIGRYTNKEDAARVYDNKAKQLYGEFAVTNF